MEPRHEGPLLPGGGSLPAVQAQAPEDATCQDRYTPVPNFGKAELDQNAVKQYCLRVGIVVIVLVTSLMPFCMYWDGNFIKSMLDGKQNNPSPVEKTSSGSEGLVCNINYGGKFKIWASVINCPGKTAEESQDGCQWKVESKEDGAEADERCKLEALKLSGGYLAIELGFWLAILYVVLTAVLLALMMWTHNWYPAPTLAKSFYTMVIDEIVCLFVFIGGIVVLMHFWSPLASLVTTDQMVIEGKEPTFDWVIPVLTTVIFFFEFITTALFAWCAYSLHRDYMLAPDAEDDIEMGQNCFNQEELAPFVMNPEPAFVVDERKRRKEERKEKKERKEPPGAKREEGHEEEGANGKERREEKGAKEKKKKEKDKKERGKMKEKGEHAKGKKGAKEEKNGNRPDKKEKKHKIEKRERRHRDRSP